MIISSIFLYLECHQLLNIISVYPPAVMVTHQVSFSLYPYYYKEYSAWWYTGSPLCGHVQNKAQNIPLQQGIPSIVSHNIFHCLPWWMTLATTLDMDVELCLELWSVHLWAVVFSAKLHIQSIKKDVRIAFVTPWNRRISIFMVCLDTFKHLLEI